MKYIHPRNKDERVVTKFLWFPVRIANETRWLETVKINQIFKTFSENTDGKGRWINRFFKYS